MDSSTPAAGKAASTSAPALTSHTENFGTDGEVAFDQTIKVKMPGSGMTVFNRYKLDRVLGRGGMGVVWLADDLKLERPVALKFLPSLIGLDPAAVKELKVETRRGLELSHPHIVRIYDFVDDDDAAAISMEFVDGKTLSELRMGTANGVFNVNEISGWLLGVCDALDYAHFQRKVVHRDLKPANIMITTKDAVAKIADFGIARSLSDTMSRLSAAHVGTSGTLPYMSPQQAMGERPLPTDDVYSLGATLYELLSGKPPFYRGDLPTQINSKIPPSVMERRHELDIHANEAVPKQWEDAIAACLHKDPNVRPSCAGALAELLGLRPTTASARSLPSYTGQTRTRATTAMPAAPQKASSLNVPLLATAAVVVLGAAGFAGWYLVGNRPNNPSGSGIRTSQIVVPRDDADGPKSPAGSQPDAPEPPSGTTAANPAGGSKTPPETTPETGATAAAGSGAAVAGGANPPPTAPASAGGTEPAPTTSTTAAAGAPAMANATTGTPDSTAAPATAPAVATNPQTGTTPDSATGGTPATGSANPAPGVDGTAASPTSPVQVAMATPTPNVAPPPATPDVTTAPAVGTTTPPVINPDAPKLGLPLEPTVDPMTFLPIAGAPRPPGPPLLVPLATGQALALPPDTVLPPGAIDTIMEQTTEKPPPGGWPMEELFPTAPFSEYSPKGKEYLVYRAQTILKLRGLYTETVDARAGTNTHLALVYFQGQNRLRPTGKLDVPTLAALRLSTETDYKNWPGIVNVAATTPNTTAPAAAGGGNSDPGTKRQPYISPGSRSKGRSSPPGGARYSPQQQEGPSFGEKFKGLFKN